MKRVALVWMKRETEPYNNKISCAGTVATISGVDVSSRLTLVLMRNCVRSESTGRTSHRTEQVGSLSSNCMF